MTIKDDKTEVPQSVTEYNQIAADRSYTAILSSSNVSASTAIGPSAESNKIPTIALGPVSAFTDGTTPTRSRAWRSPRSTPQAMSTTSSDRGRVPRDWLHRQDLYGDDGNEATVAAAEAAGIEVVLDESIDVAATDFTAADLQGEGRQARRLPGLGGRSGSGDHHQAVRRAAASRCS